MADPPDVTGARIGHALTALERMTRGLVHEFNNLLSAQFGYADALVEELPVDSRSYLYARQLQRTVEQAQALTRKLLIFCGHPQVPSDSVDLAEAVAAAVAALRPGLPEGVTLDAALPAGPAPIRAVAWQVELALGQLLANAVESLGPAGGDIRITLERPSPAQAAAEQPAGDRVVAAGWDEDGAATLAIGIPAGPGWAVTVRDSGRGMTPEALQSVFYPFASTKPRGGVTGLGLALVHGIVAGHGGALRVRSRPGDGTRITMLLPDDPPRRPFRPTGRPRRARPSPENQSRTDAK